MSAGDIAALNQGYSGGYGHAKRPADPFGLQVKGEVDLNGNDTATPVVLSSGPGFTGIVFTVSEIATPTAAVTWIYLAANNTLFNDITQPGLRWRWPLVGIDNREIIVPFGGVILPTELQIAPDADPGGAAQLTLTYTTISKGV